MRKRVEKISKNFKIATNLFRNIHSLIFISLEKDFRGKIIELMGIIKAEFDAIVGIDLAEIFSVIEDTSEENLFFLTNLISDFLQRYQVIR